MAVVPDPDVELNLDLVAFAWREMHRAEEGYALYRRAWRGELEEAFAVEGFEERFKSATGKFGANYCAAPILHTVGQLAIENLEVIDEPDKNERARKTARFRALWEAAEMDVVVNTVHRLQAIDGDAAVLVWEGDAPGEVTVDYQTASDMRDFYRPGSRKIAYRAKRWLEPDGRYKLYLYFFDGLPPEERRIEKYIQSKSNEGSSEFYSGSYAESGSNWEPYYEDEETGLIPVLDATGAPLLTADRTELLYRPGVLRDPETGQPNQVWPLPITFERDPIESFHGNLDPFTGYGQSDLFHAIKPQNGLNKLIISRHIAHDLALVKPRIALEDTAAGATPSPYESTLEGDPLEGITFPDVLDGSPEFHDAKARVREAYERTLRDVKAGDVISVSGVKSLIELTTADPAGLIAAENDEITHLAVACAMSLTLLLAGTVGADASGEARRWADELNVVKMDERKTYNGKLWERVAALLMEAAGESPTRFRCHFRDRLMDVSEKYALFTTLQQYNVPNEVILTMLGFDASDALKWQTAAAETAAGNRAGIPHNAPATLLENAQDNSPDSAAAGGDGSSTAGDVNAAGE